MALNTGSVYGTPGGRLYPLHNYPTARAGGLMLYPVSAPISGLTSTINLASYTGAPIAAIPSFTWAIADGMAYLDGEICSFANGGGSYNFTATPSANSLVFGYNDIDVYLNPTRTVIPWTGINLPTVTGGATANDINRLNGTVVQVGDIVAHCKDYGTHLICSSFYIVTVGGAAGAITLAKYDPSFAPPTMEGRLRTWGNAMAKTTTGTNVSLSKEKHIYIGTQYPPYVNSNSQALLREPASLSLGTLRLFVFKFPLEIRLDLTAGSATTQIEPETAAILAASSGLTLRGKTPSATAALGATTVRISVSGTTLTMTDAVPANVPADESINGGLFEIVANADASNSVLTLPYGVSGALSSYTPNMSRLV